MKKGLSLFLSLVIALGVCLSAPFSLIVRAENAASFKYELNDDGASYSITGYTLTGMYGELSFPSSYQNLPVTSIASNAFSNYNGSLTSLVIPDSITSIGSSAFSGNKKISSVKLSSNLNSIGGRAFSDCVGLESISIPSSVTTLGNGVFYGCTSLRRIDLSDKIVSIPKNSFTKCTSLYQITLPSSVVDIGQEAFSGCTYLAKINFSENLNSIGDSAFSGCKNLTSVSFPDSLFNIENNAFSNCTTLSVIENLKGVKKIGEGVFNNTAYYNTESNWENDVLYIESCLISAKQTLVGEYTVKTDTTYILTKAFADCTLLEKIVIPRSIRNIGANAFYNTGFYNDSSNWENDVLYIDNFLVNSKPTISGHCSIKENIVYIADEAFSGCEFFESISIPQTLEKVGFLAFYGCDNLMLVEITDLHNWCEVIFNDKYSNPLYYARNIYLDNKPVMELVIPDDVTSIGDYVFENAKLIESVIILGSVESIGVSAFENCTRLKQIVFGNGVDIVKKAAFNKCENLKYIFYTGSKANWESINISELNECLEINPIHYNTTSHFSGIRVVAPTKNTTGKIIDECPVCGYINSEKNIFYVNDYIACYEKDGVLYITNGELLIIDYEGLKDLSEVLLFIGDGELFGIPNSSYGFYGTGSKVQVADSTGTQVAEYTLVVRGDVNGDSVCDALDLMLIELARTNNTTLEGVYFTAANLSEDNEINIDDFTAAVNRAVA